MLERVSGWALAVSMTAFWVARLACSCLSLFYPCIASFTAIRTRDELAQTQWLMYWILNGLFVVFEEVFDFAVSSIPIYYEIKALLVVWLIAPGFNGASLLYTRFLAPWLKENEGAIDAHVDRAAAQAQARVQAAGTQGQQILRDQGARLLRTASATAQGMLNDCSDSATAHADEKSHRRVK